MQSAGSETQNIASLQFFMQIRSRFNGYHQWHMIAVRAPGGMVSNLNAGNMFCDVFGCEAIIKMIRLIGMPVQIKCRMVFFSLYLLMMQMVGTMDAPFFKKFYNAGMIAPPARPVPDGIAVKIAG